METELRLAVLIDAENFSSKYVKQLFDEIAEDGHASIRRVYGGWTAPQLKPWQKVLETYSITTRQECCYSFGKSSSDSAMIIDAMDILYSGVVDGFCLASSDGDFTNLARRIREAGKIILGAGENKTPKSFVNSCNKFIYVDLLEVSDSPKGESEGVAESTQIVVLPEGDSSTEADTLPDNIPTGTIGVREEVGPTSLDLIKGELIHYFEGKASRGLENRAYLGTIGTYLRKKRPDFDCRNYKCNTLVQLVKKFEEFDIEELPSESDPKVKAIYVVCNNLDKH